MTSSLLSYCTEQRGQHATDSNTVSLHNRGGQTYRTSEQRTMIFRISKAANKCGIDDTGVLGT